MTEKTLSNEQFLTHLTTLLTKTHTSTHGSVFLSQKPSPQHPSQTLIRATNGKSKAARKDDPKAKVKLNTLVDVESVPEFYQKYSEVCKRGMEGLRKRDKKKAKAKKKGKDKGRKG